MPKNNRRAQGTGSIYKRTVTRSGREYTYWEGSVTVGYDPGSGRQVRKSFTGKTQKEVREAMQAAAVEVQEGTFFEPSKLTVAQWFETWLSEYCGDKKYLTVKQYRSMYETHIKPALGAVKLSKLTPPQVQGFYNELGRTGRTVTKRDRKGNVTTERAPLSAKTVKNIHGIMSKSFDTAMRQGLIKRNPAELATVPKVEKKEVCPLTEEQIKAFMAACDGDEYGRIFKLIIFTGLREGEAIGLTWDCVNFESGTLKISKQLQKRPERDGGYTFAPLKNDKARVLTVAPFVIQLLREQRSRQAEERLAAGEGWQGWQNEKERDTALVFTKPDGIHVDATVLYKHYKRIAESIGAPESRVHDLRHTFAVLSLQNGDDVKTVQGNLGHATAAFTLDVYGHVSERMREDSAARMQSYIENLA